MVGEEGYCSDAGCHHRGRWTSLDVGELKPSLMTLSPHRFHGPKGIGVLYKRRGVTLEPLVHGGNQEFGLRAGTENVASIVGAGKAFELMSQTS
jgi:cysteine desulfurase